MLQAGAEGSILSQYCLQLLFKHHITTVREFLDTDVPNLSKILRTDARHILDTKQDLLLRFGPQPVRLSELFQRQNASIISYQTGISSLDGLLSDACEPLQSSSIWELCGLVGTGKTEIFHTLALNFVCNYSDSNVLFIDSKKDFSGFRIREMLRARNVPKTECGLAMQAIRVTSADSAENVVQTLHLLKQGLEVGAAEVANIKLVLIDSLPAVWLNFRGDEERKQSQLLLTKLCLILRRLAKQHSVAFVLGNLTLSDQTEEDDPDDYDLDDETGSQRSDPKEGEGERTLLGQYWSTVAHLRLALETIPIDQSNGEEYCIVDFRKLKVLKSSKIATGVSCILHLTAAGVV